MRRILVVTIVLGITISDLEALLLIEKIKRNSLKYWLGMKDHGKGI